MSDHYSVKLISGSNAVTNQMIGVTESTSYVNLTNRIVYIRKRSGLVMPVEPMTNNRADLPDGVVVRRTWSVTGPTATREFIAINKSLNDVDPTIREAISNGLVKTRNGYTVTISYHITQEDLDRAGELYIDSLDVILGKDSATLSPHPSSEKGIAITNSLPDGRFILSIRIVCGQPNRIFYLSCPNGVYPIEAVYSPSEETGTVTVYSGENKKLRSGLFKTLTLEEALRGDQLKLFESKEMANCYFTGDEAKIKTMEAENQARISMMEEKIRIKEVEHETKMKTLILEQQNTQQKGFVESIKLIPIIGTVFGLVAGLLGF